jgi:hypothetical protein
VLTVVGFIFHRRAYKPLVDGAGRGPSGAEASG